MSTAYRLIAGAWNQRTEGGAFQRHRAGDLVSPSTEDVERLLRAGAIEALEVTEADDDLADTGQGDTVQTSTSDATDNAATEGAAEASVDSDKPKKAAAVDEWREYAVAQGFDRDQVDEMTKAELIAAVG